MPVAAIAVCRVIEVNHSCKVDGDECFPGLNVPLGSSPRKCRVDGWPWMVTCSLAMSLSPEPMLLISRNSQPITLLLYVTFFTFFFFSLSVFLSFLHED